MGQRQGETEMNMSKLGFGKNGVEEKFKALRKQEL